MIRKLACLLTLFICIYIPSKSQQEVAIKDTLTAKLNSKYLSGINTKFSSLNDKIEKKTLQILQQLEKQEKTLQKKLSTKDSLAAKEVFKGTEKYQQLISQIKNSSAQKKLSEYIPEFDSLQTSLTFLKTPNLSSTLPTGISDKITRANSSLQSFQSKLQQANEVKSFIKERREYLKNQLQNFGLVKDMKKLNKQAYYYQQQLSEYKGMLKDRSKVEQQALTQLRKLPAFSAFMKKNSMLAQLFPMPENYGTPQALAGLQTRASVQSQLLTRFASAGTNPQQYLQQQMGQAQGELSKLKDKLTKAGGGSSDIEMPDFKPNSQKTKSFLKRIEYGANIQSQKTNAFLPVTSDIALTVGYKLNDKSIIGIGASYKLGWGNGWQHIKFTNEGVGLRSYMDWKLAPIFGKIEGFWISGGYEQNYQQSFTKINQLKDLNAWQTSGLIGMTKKYKIGKTTNNVQVLWDFLSYKQIPRRQPILFRVGYTF